MKFSSRAVQFLFGALVLSICFGPVPPSVGLAAVARARSPARPVKHTPPTADHTAPSSNHQQQSQLQQPPPTSQDSSPVATRRRIASRSLENVLAKWPHFVRQPPGQAQPTPPSSTPTGPQASAASVASAVAVAKSAAGNSSCPASETSPGTADSSQDDSLNAAQQQQQVSFGFTQARVSEFVKPNFYTLRLQLDPNKRKFTGQLMVKLDLVSSAAATSTSGSNGQPESRNSTSPTSTRYLTLHAGAHINIKKAFYVFMSRSNVQIPATKIGRNLDQELLTLDFHPNTIPIPSQGLLLLVYSGQVSQTVSRGLFVHRYSNYNQQQQQSATLNNNNELVNGLATHMEPGFARCLFPGWDEPHLKARFNLIVLLPFRGYEIISNMPVKRKSAALSCSGEPLQEVEFHTTPTMSTYLLVLVVGRLEHIESITSNNCQIRAYFYANQLSGPSQKATTISQVSVTEQQQQQNITTKQQQQLQQQQPDQLNQRRQAAQMALEFAVRTFDYLEGQLGVRYPLVKFDMVALRDFDSGGMENWGAAIFHENYLLCDNSSSNANIRVNGGSNRPRRLVVPLVVAHEIVHQWFGNLLTSRTWTYLWLNEGFAQLLMYEVAQALFPHENYWHIFMEDNRKSAMLEDELITSSRALELGDVASLSQEEQLSLFDQLTYNKGALLLRMVQFALGPREFMAGLRHYLWKHAYGSVVSHDLWSALEESSTGRLQDKQLESVMAPWLAQEGFPLVSLRVTSSADQPDYKLELRQERFTLLPGEASGWQPTQVVQGGTAERVERESGSNSSSDSNSNSSPTDKARDKPWSNLVWSIPMTIASEQRPQPGEQELRLWPAAHESGPAGSGPPTAAFLFNDKTATVTLPKAALGDWFKLNYKAIGYFRVDYQTVEMQDQANSQQSIDLLARMIPAIRNGQLTTLDRYNIIEDLFAMVLAGRKSLVYYLQFLQEAYHQEEEPLVLRFIFESLERVKLAVVSNVGQWPTSATRNTDQQRRVAQLEWSFDRYVQRFVRKLIGAFKMRQQQQQQQQETTSPPMTHHHHRPRSAADGDSARQSDNHQHSNSPAQLETVFLSLARKRKQLQEQEQARHKRSGNNGGNNSTNNSNSAGELLELLDSVRLTYSTGRGPTLAVALAAAANRGPIQSDGPTGPQDNWHTLNNNDNAGDDEPPLWAAHLFARHFRHSQLATTTTAQAPSASSSPSSGHQKSPLDLMGRELRASIYSAALNHKQQQPHQSGSNGDQLEQASSSSGPTAGDTDPAPFIGDEEAVAARPPPATTNELRDYVTSATNNLELMRQQMRATAAATQNDPNGANLNSHHQEDVVFARLLAAYESYQRSMTAGLERAVIAQALGSTRNLTKQVYLLNLTLSQGFFRQGDAGPLLDSMAQTNVGRQLIWLQLNEQTKLFRQRQLLSVALKSVSKGLIEQQQPQPAATNGAGPDQQQQASGTVERQLRQLYAAYGAGEHGKFIGQSIEWVRINTLWFKRDHEALAEFLDSATNQPPSPLPATMATTTTTTTTTNSIS